MTLLMAATKHNQANVVLWLLKRNADINAKNEMKPVRQVACCVRRVDRLCESIWNTIPNKNSRVVPLYLCHPLCLQGGASTALMIAAKEGNLQMIKFLLEHGADINAVNKVIIGLRAAME